MPNITLSSSDTGGCDILLGDVVIGIIEGTYDTLAFIEIESENRGEGYGQRAVELYVKRAVDRGFSTIETSAVTSSAMEHILENLGFHRAAHDPSHFVAELPDSK